MKAIRIEQTGSPEVLQYVDVSTPAPGRGQVLVRVTSASVNFADTMMRQGTYPMMPPLPFTPGLEYSGVIEAVGDGVADLTPGRSVVVFGSGAGYAQYAVADAREAIPIPDDLDKDLAAVMPTVYLTAYHMLHTLARIQAGQWVLVHAAAGGVGTAAIQLARLAGAHVIGLTSTEEKLHFAKDQGADYVINYRREDVVKRVHEITGGRGVDAIFNSVAGDTLNRDFELLAPLGQIIWFGLAAGLPPENLVQQFATHFGRGVGVRAFHLIFSVAQPYPELMMRAFETVLGLLTARKICPHIHERIPLASAAQAHRLLESGAVKGKLILKP